MSNSNFSDTAGAGDEPIVIWGVSEVARNLGITRVTAMRRLEGVEPDFVTPGWGDRPVLRYWLPERVRALHDAGSMPAPANTVTIWGIADIADAIEVGRHWVPQLLEKYPLTPGWVDTRTCSPRRYWLPDVVRSWRATQPTKDTCLISH